MAPVGSHGVTIFLFGVFTIWQWHAQTIANDDALQANQLALLAIYLPSNAVGVASETRGRKQHRETDI
jgi:hypothetical protein